ncbi:MAG: RNA-binding S4 domain-containing protein [Clostridia bacterium]|nr:RNA-binding S4 domain-containing protein [Clostridia bacterium]
MKIKVKVAPKEHQEFILKGDYIRLDDLLKNVSAVQTGGHAKIVIQDGEVKVNGEVCTMRGKKMRSGDSAEFERIIYDVK